MLKTTVYLSEELKRKLGALARRRRTSEARLIREGLEQLVHDQSPRRPTFPLFNSGKPGLWRHPDEELLKGFGER
ncbi:MAG: CopG family transcriptional regulator [Chloroflexota bacterium]